MLIFIIFKPCLLPQLSEKKKIRRKIYEKNIKLLVKLPRELKQSVLIVEGG